MHQNKNNKIPKRRSHKRQKRLRGKYKQREKERKEKDEKINKWREERKTIGKTVINIFAQKVFFFQNKKQFEKIIV